MAQSHLPHLRACPACARHVRVSEESCPFCRAGLGPSFRASPAPRPPRVRLTRAALFAFGTGTLALAPGCTSSSPGTEQIEGGAQPGYGGSPNDYDSGGADSAKPTDAGADVGDAPIVTEDAGYGAAPFEDDAGDAGDAAQNLLIDAAYGGFAIADDAGDADLIDSGH